MRLINCTTLELVDFTKDVPPYAILSHTWKDQEVIFQDMNDLTKAAKKKGFTKIKATCNTALKAGYQYCWVDTCCIDKSSSAELSEAINSMFAWYQRSAVCIAYLSDLNLDRDASLEEQLRQCRWFTRGWTLQELIAPHHVDFYDQSWHRFASKSELGAILSNITRIEEGVLRGEIRCDDVLIGKRMSWASGRTTTREEDIAYCLLGIFDVNMPLLYGEGPKAFTRLEEEIIKSSMDLSIFAWKSLDSSQHYSGLLAALPSEFADCADLIASNSYFTPYANEYVTTNNRLRIQRVLRINDARDAPNRDFILPLRCKSSESSAECVVLLRQCGSSLFVRIKPYSINHSEARAETSHRALIHLPQYILLRDSPSLSSLIEQSRRNAIFLRLPDTMVLVARGENDIYPWPRWDNYNHLLLSNGEDEFWGMCTIALKSDIQQGIRQPGLAIVVCGKRPGDAGFFYAIVVLDDTHSWFPRATSQLELMTASIIYEKILEHQDVFSQADSLAFLRVPAQSTSQVEISVDMDEYKFVAGDTTVPGKVINVKMREVTSSLN